MSPPPLPIKLNWLRRAPTPSEAGRKTHPPLAFTAPPIMAPPHIRSPRLPPGAWATSLSPGKSLAVKSVREASSRPTFPPSCLLTCDNDFRPACVAVLWVAAGANVDPSFGGLDAGEIELLTCLESRNTPVSEAVPHSGQEGFEGQGKGPFSPEGPNQRGSPGTGTPSPQGACPARPAPKDLKWGSLHHAKQRIWSGEECLL